MAGAGVESSRGKSTRSSCGARRASLANFKCFRVCKGARRTLALVGACSSGIVRVLWLDLKEVIQGCTGRYRCRDGRSKADDRRDSVDRGVLRLCVRKMGQIKRLQSSLDLIEIGRASC